MTELQAQLKLKEEAAKEQESKKQSLVQASPPAQNQDQPTQKPQAAPQIAKPQAESLKKYESLPITNIQKPQINAQKQAEQKPAAKPAAKQVAPKPAEKKPLTMEEQIKKALPDVTEEDIENGDQDIENPLAKIFGEKHPEIMQHYSERQYESESYPGSNIYLQRVM